MKDDEDFWKLYAASVKRVKKGRKRSTNAGGTSLPLAGVTRRRRAAKRWTEGGLVKLSCVYQPSPNPTSPVAPTPLNLPNLERRTERHLRQGDLTVEARLDLHGKTQTEAYEALARFMAAQVKAGRRRLLIITGKGAAQKGVLRTNLPNWLQTLPEAGQILALRAAAPKHGGDGAFYILLKKKK